LLFGNPVALEVTAALFVSGKWHPHRLWLGRDTFAVVSRPPQRVARHLKTKYLAKRYRVRRRSL